MESRTQHEKTTMCKIKRSLREAKEVGNMDFIMRNPTRNPTIPTRNPSGSYLILRCKRVYFRNIIKLSMQKELKENKTRIRKNEV